jgi:Leucine-rich repeat (LRR) protein
LRSETKDTRIVSVKINNLHGYGNGDIIALRIYQAIVTFLPSGLEAFMPNLIEMYVQESGLRFIERSNFMKMKNLQVLSFHVNNIKRVPEDALLDLKNLEYLSFSCNQIEKFIINHFPQSTRFGVFKSV